MKIAYFSHDSILEGVGASQVLGICKELAKLNIDVYLYTFEKKSPSIEFKEEIQKTGIKWTWYAFGSSSFPAMRRILTLVNIQEEFDLIHARGDLAAFSAVLRASEKVLWDIRSLWYEQKHVLDPVKFNPIIGLFLRILTRYISRRVSGVNSLTHAIVPYLNNRFPKLTSNRTVVSTCVDLEAFHHERTMPNERRALLSGTYNEIYDYFLINSFLEYEQNIKGTEVVWAQNPESHSKLAMKGCEIVVSNYFSMPRLIAQSSFGIAICRNDLGISLDAAMPTKIAEFLAVGRPVIVNSRMGDCATVLVKNNVAIVLDTAKNIPEVSEELDKLLSDPDLSNRCRFVASKHFSLAQGARTYSNLYTTMLAE